ncbi:antibacterial peptide PMAP-37-like isoform X1 [Rana temporaria]|uniref:antibacterial peptide PMAP-37-like isoform X1 n=1 Tax=Rana temporaria TaxID=8407 RepID=UPI001AADE45D|nr:antibacterial peptide PMAP-37-like isoform X1 [Rana temporaria]
MEGDLLVPVEGGWSDKQNKTPRSANHHSGRRAETVKMAAVLWALIALGLGPVIDSAPLPWAALAAGHSELISEAVANYNKGSDSEFVFTLLADEDGGKTEPEEPNDVKFSIKETVCQKSEYKTTERCDYKAGGVEKSCTASMKENHFTVICTNIADGNNKDGGLVAKSSEGERGHHKGPSRERTVIITEKRVIPEEEEKSPEDEDDDYDLPDTVIEFHDDRQEGDGADRRSESQERRVFHGDILGRLLCLSCIIDIFPRK